jgi:hypothetical protein
MNTVIWILQGMIAMMFLMAGFIAYGRYVLVPA